MTFIATTDILFGNEDGTVTAIRAGEPVEGLDDVAMRNLRLSGSVVDPSKLPQEEKGDTDEERRTNRIDAARRAAVEQFRGETETYAPEGEETREIETFPNESTSPVLAPAGLTVIPGAVPQTDFVMEAEAAAAPAEEPKKATAAKKAEGAEKSA
jgi:hypothetical protein